MSSSCAKIFDANTVVHILPMGTSLPRKRVEILYEIASKNGASTLRNLNQAVFAKLAQPSSTLLILSVPHPEVSLRAALPSWLWSLNPEKVALVNVEWLAEPCEPWSSHQLHSSMFYPAAAAAELTAAAAASAYKSSKYASQPPTPPPPLPSRGAPTVRLDGSAGASTRGAPLAERRDEPVAYTPGERALFSASERISFTDEEQWRTLMIPYRLAVTRWEQEQAALAMRYESQRNPRFFGSDTSTLIAISISGSVSAAPFCADSNVELSGDSNDKSTKRRLAEFDLQSSESEHAAFSAISISSSSAVSSSSSSSLSALGNTKKNRRALLMDRLASSQSAGSALHDCGDNDVSRDSDGRSDRHDGIANDADGTDDENEDDYFDSTFDDVGAESQCDTFEQAHRLTGPLTLSYMQELEPGRAARVKRVREHLACQVTSRSVAAAADGGLSGGSHSGTQQEFIGAVRAEQTHSTFSRPLAKNQVSGPNLNPELSALFEFIADSDKREFASMQYKRAALVIKQLPFRIKTLADVNSSAVKKIGKKGMYQKICEWVRTRRIQRADDLRNNPRVATLTAFEKIFDVGPATAAKLWDQGYRTLSSLKEHDSPLTWRQRIGLDCYDDFQQRIPRDEVAFIESYVLSIASALLPGIVACACGSYRRGKPSCGDVDIIFTHSSWIDSVPAPRILEELGVFLKQLVQELHRRRFLTHDLRGPGRNDGHSSAAYMGVCVPARLRNLLSGGSANDETDPGTGTSDSKSASATSAGGASSTPFELTPFAASADDANGPPPSPPSSPPSSPRGLNTPIASANNFPFANGSSGTSTTFGSPGKQEPLVHRRIDIKVYPVNSFPFALLYFTGSDHFNRSMRFYCRQAGLSLNDHGLGRRVHMGKDKFPITGTSIRVFSEREVFSFLELTYVPPNERNVFENFMVESAAAPGGTRSAPA